MTPGRPSTRHRGGVGAHIDARAESLDALVDDIRAHAGDSVGEALARGEIALAEVGEHGPLIYLLAELNARLGRAHDALDLIDRAVASCRGSDDELARQRYEVGRIGVLDALGRHDEAIATATAVVHRLGTLGLPLPADVGPTVTTAPPGRPAAAAHVDALATIAVRALSNRALCWESVGAYESAFDDYQWALAILPTTFDPLFAAQLQINRSNVLDLLGRSGDAIAALEVALAVVERDGDREDLVKVLANLGALACRRGDFERGLAWFGRAEQLVEPATVDACAISVETAEVYAALGAVDEATHRYREALAALADAPISWLDGRAWLGLGITLARSGERSDARAALRTAIDSFQASDNFPLTIAALLELSSVESADPGLHAIVVDQVRRAVSLADVDRWPVQACMAQLRLGELDDGAEGERLLRNALRLAERAELAPLTMRAHQHLGRHLLRRSRVGDARPHVEAAAALADALRNRLRHHPLLRIFPTETASCFDDLVTLRLCEGDVAGAARAADRGRSRSLLDLAPLRDGAPSEVVELELELDVLYDRLLGSEMDSVSDRSRLDRRVRELEQSLERLRVRLDPDAGGPEPLAAATPAPARARLTLMFHVDRGELGAFVMTPDGDAQWFATVADLRDVAQDLDRFQSDGRRTWAMGSVGVAPASGALTATTRRLERLGSALLAPIGPLLSRARETGELLDLLIVPTKGLWAVPFTALRWGGEALIDRAQVTLAPSPSVAATRPARATGRSLVVGVAGMGIPGAAVEARGVASLHVGSKVLLDEHADLEAIRRACVDGPSAPAVVHLASHGVYRPHAPLQSGVRLADGWLTSDRAARLRLDGSLVVLSACDTGRASVAEGEEILGAQYGFLAGGAHAVVMSMWPAHDARTVELMGALHRRLVDGDDPAAALRAAQLWLRSVHPHPWWWASFTLSGG